MLEAEAVRAFAVIALSAERMLPCNCSRPPKKLNSLFFMLSRIGVLPLASVWAAAAISAPIAHWKVPSVAGAACAKGAANSTSAMPGANRILRIRTLPKMPPDPQLMRNGQCAIWQGHEAKSRIGYALTKPEEPQAEFAYILQSHLVESGRTCIRFLRS
jgi:hypothetical protein